MNGSMFNSNFSKNTNNMIIEDAGTEKTKNMK